MSNNIIIVRENPNIEATFPTSEKEIFIMLLRKRAYEYILPVPGSCKHVLFLFYLFSCPINRPDNLKYEIGNEED